MANSLGTLVVNIAADVARLRADMGKATKTVEGAAAKMKAAAATAGRALAGIAAGIGVAGLVSFVRSAANAADEMGKLSQRIGISVEDLSRLSYAGSLANVSQDELAQSVKLLSKNISQAAAGTQAYAKVFKALGIEVQDQNGQLRGTTAIMLDVADSFAALEDGAVKTALAQKLFGRAGADLIPLLNQGSAALRAQFEEAERLGVTFDTVTAKNAELLNDSMTRLSALVTGATRGIALAMVPALATLAERMAAAATSGDGMLRVLRAIPEAIADLARGSDQERLGELLLREINLEKQLANLRKAAKTDPAVGRDLIPRYEEQLRRVQAEMKGLQLAIDTVGPQLAEPVIVTTAATEDLVQALGSTASASEKIVRIDPFTKLDATARAAVDTFDAASDALDDLIDGQNKLAASIAEQTRTPFESYLNDIRAARKLVAAGKLDAGTFARYDKQLSAKLMADVKSTIPELESLDDALNDAADTAADFGLTMASAFEEAIIGGGSLRDVLKGLERDILQMVTRKLVTEPLGNAIAGFAGNLGGGFFGSIFGGGRAAGGPVSAGRAYMVGERGPELMVPKSAGTVVPAGGFGGITINVYGVTDADSFNRSRAQVAAAAQSALARASQRNG